MTRNWITFLCLVAVLGALILEVKGSPFKDPTSSPSPFSSEEELQTESQEQPVCEPSVETRISDCLEDADKLFVEDEVEQKLNCQTRIPDAIASCEEMFEKHQKCFSRLMKPIIRALIIMVVKSHHRKACLTISEQEKTQAEFNRQFIDDPDMMKALFALSLYNLRSQRGELQG